MQVFSSSVLPAYQYCMHVESILSSCCEHVQLMSKFIYEQIMLHIIKLRKFFLSYFYFNPASGHVFLPIHVCCSTLVNLFIKRPDKDDIRGRGYEVREKYLGEG